MKNKEFRKVSNDIDFNSLEIKNLKLWQEINAFQRSISEKKDKPLYNYYDGPPFATGLPHYGHLLTGTIKDIVLRYWTMRGYQVPRIFGWDCHGVPVENEINKKFSITSAQQVKELGIAQYNQECRSIVNRYTEEWKKTVYRMGRWIEMENPYRTMDLSFMQSVWWVFKQIWNKNLIYEGYKVVPYSTGLSTVLSNFEASQNYKNVLDPSITVEVNSQDSDEIFLIWTTTPWTLPSNLAITVHPEFEYALIQTQKNKKYWILKSRIHVYENQFGDYEILKTSFGKELKNKKYKPIFNYFAALQNNYPNCFSVLTGDHVTEDSGTGFVHTAPGFGEEDFEIGKLFNLPIVTPIDEDCRFTNEISDFQNIFVKDADLQIIQFLKDNKILFKNDKITHNYPFCERTDKPLIYRAISSWFINVEAIKNNLVKNNNEINWVPNFIKEGRFGNWISQARDWAVSRNRFWGTPLPIWKNDEGETICIGSIQELEALSGKKINDLHLENINNIEIPSKNGGSPLKQTGGVLDCWFESGSMPFAQWGYPFNVENKKYFENGFPADFIAEGIDQTRGWFYTLLVISTAIFDKPPFKNVIVNGLVLAEDGKKMSKRLKNYPDPNEVIEKYGADALRLYLIDSPVVKAEDLCFSEQGVRNIARRILIRLWNAYSFFVNYASIDNFSPRHDYVHTKNTMDLWILSKLHSLIDFTHKEMNGYRLYTVVPAVLNFVEELTNTYIRLNRKVFWSDENSEEKRLSYETFFYILCEVSKLMAPFSPFISEEIYQNLKIFLNHSHDSVHLEETPKMNPQFIKPKFESAIDKINEICESVRFMREKLKIKGKIPLKKLTIYNYDSEILQFISLNKNIFIDEINVLLLEFKTDEEKVAELEIKPNFAILGKKLGAKMKEFAQKVSLLSENEIKKIINGESVLLDQIEISLQNTFVRKKLKVDALNMHVSENFSYILDTSLDESQINEGIFREILRRVQITRKEARLKYDQRIELGLILPDDLYKIVELNQERFCKETLTEKLSYKTQLENEKYSLKEAWDQDHIIISIKEI